ncbi:phosphoadenosine phosphosulfate reductase [Pseudooceanicola aestuarii]|uniref:phosphoadenosine phosphosulfate reductase n=1 Tax=Pseudooceanicola aestuarii TaxID=2697319 RepID=UPI0013D21575|nr:phosphoadenosine phosphosulfate reductase [Pseudooceanicola aestuarii]
MAQDSPVDLSASLSHLSRADWLRALMAVSREAGHFQPLGKRHFAAMIDGGRSLLVSFETIQGMQSLNEGAQPLGWTMVRDHGWSHMCLASDGDTWFRNPRVYAFFDRLIDDGIFEEFDQVLFYGAGPCAYAACAFSVAAPGARVVAVQPQATLDPRVTEWDDRFSHMRRTSFTDRYGYAPDMIDAAERVHVLYDPRHDMDAMHAALFTRPHVTKLRLPFMGEALQGSLLRMGMFYPLLEAAMLGELTPARFAVLHRARRDHPPYLRSLLGHLETEERERLVYYLCANVSDRLSMPRFRKRLERFENADRPLRDDAAPE